jgi:hypothetical protein
MPVPTADLAGVASVAIRGRGPLARLNHALHLLTVEGEYMHHYERELLTGHCLIMVRTEGADRRHRALEILKAHGGHFINQFGFWGG